MQKIKKQKKLRNISKIPEDGNKSMDKPISDDFKPGMTQEDQQDRFKVLFDWAPDPYYLNDFKGNLLDGNKATELLTGYKKAELIGNSFSSLNILPKSQIPKAAKVLAKNKSGQSTGPDEFVLRRKDGRKITVEIRTFPVELEGKKVVLGIARDISKRKKIEGVLRRHRANLQYLIDERTMDLRKEILERINAEDAKRASEEKFRLLFEGASEGIIYLDAEGTIIDVNPKLLEMIDTKRENLIGQNALTAMKDFEMDYELKASTFEEVFKGKSPENNEFKIKNKSGEELVVKAHPSLIKKNDETVGLSIFLEDVTKEWQMERALTKSVEEMKAIFDGIADGVALLDSDGRIIKINHRLREISDYPESEILGKQIHELSMFSQENITQMLDNFEAILSGDDIDPLEVEAVLKSGKKINVEIQPTLIKIGESVAGVVVSLRDITERKEYEKAIKESEEYLRTIFDGINIGVAYLDKSGKVLKMNKELLSFVDGNENEIVGHQKNFLDIFRFDDFDELRPEFDKLPYGEDVPAREAIIYHKNRHKKHVIIQAKPVIKNGKVHGVIATMKDITSQKEAEKSKQSTERLYRLISENTSDLIAICNLDGKYEHVSPSYRQLGYSPGELLDKSGMDYIHPEDLPEMIRLLELAMLGDAESKVPKTLKFRALGKNGEWYPLESKVNLIRDEEDNFTKLLFVSRRLTDNT